MPTTNDDGVSGFEKSISKSKPKPFKLTVDPKDLIKYQIKRIDFTPARFNNGEHVHETSIVTSTGKFLITWNFEKVKRGNLRGGYKIKNLHAHAVDGQFQYNHEEKVLVTLPHAINVETRAKK